MSRLTANVTQGARSQLTSYVTSTYCARGCAFQLCLAELLADCVYPESPQTHNQAPLTENDSQTQKGSALLVLSRAVGQCKL